MLPKTTNILEQAGPVVTQITPLPTETFIFKYFSLKQTKYCSHLVSRGLVLSNKLATKCLSVGLGRAQRVADLSG